MGLTVWGSKAGRMVGFPYPSRPALQHTQLLIQWILDLSWGQSCWGIAMTTHCCLGWRLKTEYNYTSTPTLCLHGTLYSELYFYSMKKHVQYNYIQTGVP